MLANYSDITPSLPKNYQRELGTVHVESEAQCTVIINAALSLPRQEHDPNAAFLFLLEKVVFTRKLSSLMQPANCYFYSNSPCL